MRDMKLSVGLRVTASGIRLLAKTDCNEQRAVAVGQIIMRLLAFLL